MTRRLSTEERALWDKLRRAVRPMRGRRAEAELAPAEATKALSEEVGPEKPSAQMAAAWAPSPRREQPLLRLEDKERRRLSRGLTDVDARIDLHGMRQERAFAALMIFLRQNQARGSRIVLVITGKARDDGSGRGILRQAVPGWLTRPDLRDLVAGFEEAGRRHGGAGALYVRLRRRR